MSGSSRKRSAAERGEIERVLAENERLTQLLRQAGQEKENLIASFQRAIALQRENAALQRDNAAKQQALYDESLKRLLKYMPDLIENQRCVPSIEDDDEAQKQWDVYNKNKETTPPPGYHEPAESESISLREEYLNFDLNVTDENQQLISSLLIQEYNGNDQGGLVLYNEASIEYYLTLALKDMLKSFGVKNLRVIQQASLFSNRPDLVVIAQDGKTIFMTKAKKPSSAVCKSKVAIGQCYDYNLIQSQFGIDNPFTVLSTYTETIVVLLDGDQQYIQKYEEILQEAQKLLKDGKLGETSTEETGKPIPSPPPKKHMMTRIDAVSVEPRTERKEREVSRDARKAKISEVFRKGELLKVFALVCAAGIIAGEKSKTSRETGGDFLVPPDGHIFSNKACRYTLWEEGFYVGRISCTVDYKTAPNSNSKHFHVYCTIEQGQNGRCILCSTTTGKMFVAKLFLVDTYPYKFAEKERKDEMQKAIKAKTIEAKSEKNRWVHLSPKKYHRYCYVKKLNHIPALTMPFFSPIPIEKRELALSQIKSLLKRIAKYQYDIDLPRKPRRRRLADNEYYLYGEVRWRHFGCRYCKEEIEITPLDLGSLKKYKCGRDLTKKQMDKHIDEEIDRQIEALKDRMNYPIPPPQISFI